MASGEFIFGSFFVRRVQVFGVTKKRRRGAMMSIDDSFSHRLRIFWDFERKNGVGSTKVFYEENVSNWTYRNRPTQFEGRVPRTEPSKLNENRGQFLFDLKEIADDFCNLVVSRLKRKETANVLLIGSPGNGKNFLIKKESI